MTTRFYYDEICFWHAGGLYASVAPVGGLVQPSATGGLPEEPETKRRLVNLMRVTGLWERLETLSAPNADRAALERVHPAAYLDEFERLSQAGGGEIGLRAPFGPGGFDIAAKSAGLAVAALEAVLAGDCANAYSLSRPPGHHCEPAAPMGFCLLNNIAVAIEAARATRPGLRVAVVDWDVHHGNGTEAAFADDEDVLTISIHQERNFPPDRGGLDAPARANANIPLCPGGGEATYLKAYDEIVRPLLHRHQPDVIIVACGYDASVLDPLSRMICGAGVFGDLTRRVMADAHALCGGKLMMTHEGGYSEVHVPFCGHAVLAAMAGSEIEAPDPFAARVAVQQPQGEAAAFHDSVVARAAAHHLG